MAKLDARKEQLLAAVVREHARTAQPVASDRMKEQAGLEVSPATIRAEMAELERAGYLKQPHTSAGRVPTEAGYRYYIANCVEEKNAASNAASKVNAFNDTMRGGSPEAGRRGSASPESKEARLKQLARELAGEIHEGVFVGFAPQSTFYTGLAYLFEQPEFESVDLVRHMGEIMDNLDHIVAELFEDGAPGVQVYVGSENPFGAHCGTVLLRAGSDQPMMGVLGPMRMDYDRTIAMMRMLEKIL